MVDRTSSCNGHFTHHQISNPPSLPLSNNTLSEVTFLSACCREEKYLLHLPGIKPIFLSRPYPTLVTTTNEISQVTRTIKAINIDVDFTNSNIQKRIIFLGGYVILPPPPCPMKPIPTGGWQTHVPRTVSSLIG
jgi:hypothetical protein